MWRHYLAMAARSLLADRVFTFVNLLGLSVGLAAVSFIFVHVTQQLSHDRWVPGHERVFRVDTRETHRGRPPLDIALAPGPLRDGLRKDFPQVEDVARLYPLEALIARDADSFRERLGVADPNFPALIPLAAVRGEVRTALRDPGGLVISERLAEKLFGSADPIGRRLTVRLPATRDFTVRGVFRTLPAASHMRFDALIPFDSYFAANSEEVRAIPSSWAGAYFHTYARLRPGARAADVERGLPAFIDRALPTWLTDLLKAPAHEFYAFRLIPLADVHFDGGDIGAMKPVGSRTALLALSGIALLILALAVINFANLTSARSTLRAREVALRKLVGATRGQIFVQFLTEAVAMTALAGVIGLSLAELAVPWLAGLLDLDTGFPAASEWRLWAMLILAVLVSAIAAGFYPSLVVSRIRPAAVFGRGAEALRGGRVRGALVVAQFAICITLIAMTLTMALQMRFAATRDLGFAKDDIVVVRLPDDSGAAAGLFRDAAARLPGVAAASLSSAVPSDTSEDNLAVTVPGLTGNLPVGMHRVDAGFFETYAIRPLAGRLPRASAGPVEADAARPVALNDSARRRLGFASADAALAQVLRAGDKAFRVVAVVPDVHFRSLHEGVRDEVYVIDDAPGRSLSLRHAEGRAGEVAAAVDRLWQARFPGLPVERAFLADELDALYASDARQAVLVTLFSVLAILLSCLGLLAMTAFVAERRTREIAIRKVLGARTGQIVTLLLWQFSRPVLLASLIAWPAAWLLARRWLDGFAYRIDMPWHALAAASTVALAVALAAVAAHAVRVARTSPAAALRRD